MSQPKGFPDPTAALLAVAVCLGDFTIPSPDGAIMLAPQVFVGDDGVGGAIDCCHAPILRIESGGEVPGDGLPMALSKQGCFNLTEAIRVTFLTCFRTTAKTGAAISDPDDLAYSCVIQAARWRAIGMLRCCADPNLKFVSSAPIGTDGKCSGFTISLTANLSLCDPCETGSVSS